MITNSITATAAAVRIATTSRTRRLLRNSGPHTVTAAATRSGTTTTSASSWSTAGLSLQVGQFLGVQRAEPLVGLDRERQQQRGDRGLDHHIGKGTRLHHGIDRRGVVREIEEVGRDVLGYVTHPDE